MSTIRFVDTGRKKSQTEVKPSQHATITRTRTMTDLLKKGWQRGHSERKKVSAKLNNERAEKKRGGLVFKKVEMFCFDTREQNRSDIKG